MSIELNMSCSIDNRMGGGDDARARNSSPNFWACRVGEGQGGFARPVRASSLSVTCVDFGDVNIIGNQDPIVTTGFDEELDEDLPE